jgi:hypothetical protein
LQHGLGSEHCVWQESAFGQSALGQPASWQHSTAGLPQHLPSLQAVFLQHPIAAITMAAINKIFFIHLVFYKFISLKVSIFKGFNVSREAKANILPKTVKQFNIHEQIPCKIKIFFANTQKKV